MGSTAACLNCEAEAMVDAGLDVQKFLVIKVWDVAVAKTQL